MKFSVPFEMRIFLVVVLVSAISVIVILDQPEPVPQMLYSGRVVQGLVQPQEPSNTLLISGIDIGQQIGFKSPTITGNEFACFEDRTIVTNSGRATVKYSLSLYDVVNGGCLVTFARPERGDPALFMKCPAGQKIYDLTMLFEPSLDSEIEDRELEDIEDETINIFGMPYSVIDTKIDPDSNRVTLRFISPVGSLQMTDNYDDDQFSDDIQANGKRILEGSVRIRATDSYDEFRMSSIEYRLMPVPVVGKDVYVKSRQGTKQHLRTPEGFLGDFDLLFKGIGGTVPASAPRPSRRGIAGIIGFDSAGDDTYNMIFTNNQGRVYSFPLISVESGSLAYGDGDNSFFFTGAGAGPPFNIVRGDMLALTNNQKRNGVTTILELSSIDGTNGRVYFNDVAAGQVVGSFDTTTGEGRLVSGGTEFKLKVDTSDFNSLTIDQDADGTLGGEAEIVTQGGPRIDLSAGGSGRLEIDASLFHDEAPSGGEKINFAFSKVSGDIDVDVTSGINLQKNDATGFEEGLSQYGVFVQLDDRRNTARDLIFNMPRSGGYSASVSVSSAPSGQAQGQVLVTCERSEFVKRAQAARNN